MREKTHRDLLLQALRRYVVPELVERGFVVTEPSPGFEEIFPLGQMRRVRSDGTVDLAEMQFKTHRRPAFRINACAVPAEGIMTVAGHRTAEELDAGGLHDHFEMYAFPRLRLWFSLRFWRLRTPAEAGYDRLARTVAAMLPEVELALHEGRTGPHMRSISYS